jgi:hypothetical protein
MATPRYFLGPVVETTTGSLAPAYPACGISAGDLIFIHAVHRELPTITWNTPATFSAVALGGTGSVPISQRQFFKVAAGGETGTVTVTTSAAGSDTKVARIVVIKGYAAAYNFPPFFFIPTINNQGVASSNTSATFFGTQGIGAPVPYHSMLLGMGYINGATTMPEFDTFVPGTYWELDGQFRSTVGAGGLSIFVQFGDFTFGQASATQPSCALSGSFDYQQVWSYFAGPPGGSVAPLEHSARGI